MYNLYIRFINVVFLQLCKRKTLKTENTKIKCIIKETVFAVSKTMDYFVLFSIEV